MNITKRFHDPCKPLLIRFLPAHSIFSFCLERRELAARVFGFLLDIHMQGCKFRFMQNAAYSAQVEHAMINGIVGGNAQIETIHRFIDQPFAVAQVVEPAAEPALKRLKGIEFFVRGTAKIFSRDPVQAQCVVLCDGAGDKGADRAVGALVEEAMTCFADTALQILRGTRRSIPRPPELGQFEFHALAALRGQERRSVKIAVFHGLFCHLSGQVQRLDRHRGAE